MDLFNQVEAPHQDGWTFNPSKDHKRLTTAMDRVMALMSDEDLRGSWKFYTTAEERSLILGEAKERGLLEAKMKELGLMP